MSEERLRNRFAAIPPEKRAVQEEVVFERMRFVDTPRPRTGKLAVDDVARVCHEAHRALCLVLGDPMAPPWPDAPDWMRQSTVEAVEWLQGQCGETAAGLHSRWMRRMREGGWTDGPVYDEEAKTHPRLWPWAQQAPAQQIKDEMFVSIVRTLGMMGWWDRRIGDVSEPSVGDEVIAMGLPENPGMVPL